MRFSRKVAVACFGAGALAFVPSLVFGSTSLPAAARDCSITCANGSNCKCTGKCSCTCDKNGSASCTNLK